MHNYRTLKVWNESIELTTKIYAFTKLFPKEELYGLTSQIRRCSVSIPSNIAEGAGRNSDKEFHHFLGIAMDSSFELETQLIISMKLSYLSEKDFNEIHGLLGINQKMLNALKQSLKGKGLKNFILSILWAF
ncbi:MAG: four helix bundle protein [Fimbriimonadaceae bacterium]|nr:four helix bundle protein [Chitinophagales bacterium]